MIKASDGGAISYRSRKIKHVDSDTCKNYHGWLTSSSAMVFVTEEKVLMAHWLSLDSGMKGYYLEENNSNTE